MITYSFAIIAPWKRTWPLFEEAWIPFKKEFFCFTFCWNWSSDSREDVNVKRFPTDGQTDAVNRGSEKFVWAFNPGAPKINTLPYFLQPSSGSHSDWLQLQLPWHCSPKEGKGHWPEQLVPKSPGGQALIYFKTLNNWFAN